MVEWQDDDQVYLRCFVLLRRTGRALDLSLPIGLRGQGTVNRACVAMLRSGDPSIGFF